MKAQAYYSDPDHYGSFVGKWLYIYRGRGTLELEDDRLTYTVGPHPRFDLTRTQVQSVKVGTFPRIAKPVPLRFLELCFSGVDGKDHSIYIVQLLLGRSPWSTPVWKTNVYVNDWLDALRRWHAGQYGGWLSSP